MRFIWQEVGHLKMSEHYDYMPKGEDIKVTGNIDPLKRKFTFKRNFWNYPALVVFIPRN